MKYDFYDEGMPSFLELASISCFECGAARRLELASAIEAAVDILRAHYPRFNTLKPERLPFCRDVVCGVIDHLRSAGVGNADVDWICRTLNEALDVHDLRHPTRWLELTPDLRALVASIGDRPRYLFLGQKRLLLLASSLGLDRCEINDTVALALRSALDADPAIAHPDKVWLTSARSWNRASAVVPGWPSLRLSVPVRRQCKGPPMAQFPAALRREVEEALQRKPRALSWDPVVRAAYARDPEGLAHSVRLIWYCVGALIATGVDRLTIQSIRDIVMPERFDRIVDELHREAGYRITRLAYVKLLNLRALAYRSGALSASELKEINESFALVEADYGTFCEENPTRGEEIAPLLQDEDVIKEVRGVPLKLHKQHRSARLTRSNAAVAKQIAVLALKLDTGLSNVLLSRLKPRHLTDLDGDLAGCIHLHIPAAETANKQAREAIICQEYAAILREFEQVWRPSLDLSRASPYVFPSNGSAPLSPRTISAQQSAFNSEKCQELRTSHGARLVLKHVILMEDTEATGVLSSVLGLRDNAYTEKLAEDYRQQKDQQEHNELTTTGRLK